MKNGNIFRENPSVWFHLIFHHFWRLSFLLFYTDLHITDKCMLCNPVLSRLWLFILLIYICQRAKAIKCEAFYVIEACEEIWLFTFEKKSPIEFVMGQQRGWGFFLLPEIGCLCSTKHSQRRIKHLYRASPRQSNLSVPIFDNLVPPEVLRI